MRWRHLTVVVLAAVFGCLSSPQDDGETCEFRGDCTAGLECVVVNDPDSVCLPIPPEREQRRCEADRECVLSTGQLWPADADCIDGFCFCNVDVECELVERGLIFEPETCRCVPIGGFGDACLSDATCEGGLFCGGGTCQRE